MYVYSDSFSQPILCISTCRIQKEGGISSISTSRHGQTMVCPMILGPCWGSCRM